MLRSLLPKFPFFQFSWNVFFFPIVFLWFVSSKSFSSSMCWSSFISKLRTRSVCTVNFLFPVRCFPSSAYLLLFEVQIRFAFEYCTHVSGVATSTVSLPLPDRVQPKVIRLILLFFQSSLPHRQLDFKSMGHTPIFCIPAHLQRFILQVLNQ